MSTSRITGRARLSNADIDRADERIAKGETLTAVAASLGVSVQTLWMIRSGNTKVLRDGPNRRRLARAA
jgi:hypothetical protein